MHFHIQVKDVQLLREVLVLEEVADKLVEKIGEKMKGLKIGNPVSIPDADIVPLIDSKAADYVKKG